MRCGVFCEYGTEEFTADFSPCTEEWQFTSVQFFKSKYRTIQYIQVYCDYGYNSGTVYFDDVQLVRNILETYLSASDFVVESTGTSDDAVEASAETTPTFNEAKDIFGNALTETTFTDGEFGTIYRSFGFTDDGNNLVSVGNCLINKSSKTLILGCINSIIPSDGSVTSIGAYAFYNCSKLISITIPDSVTSIGWNAFYGCTSLTSVIIPDSVINIGGHAFDGCTNLIESIDGVQYVDTWVIGYNGLYGSNTSVILRTGTKGIAAVAFYGCSNLKSITIPNSVTNICSQAFDGCIRLTSVTFEENSCLTSIEQMAFEDCTSLASVIIPDSVTSIGVYAFDGCTNLIESIDGVQYVDTWAIDCDASATAVTIRKGTKGIATSAFYGCSLLTSIIIPNSVTDIDETAFYGCSNLSRIYYDGDKLDWSKITIGSNNTNLADATRYWYSESEPINEGNFWHLVDGVATPWAPIFSVTLNTNGGVINFGDITKYVYGIGANLPFDINKEGYVFAGWYTDNNGQGDFVTSISNTDEGNKVYYAFWAEITTNYISATNTEVSVADHTTNESYTGDTSLDIVIPIELQNMISTGMLHVRITVTCDASLQYRSNSYDANAIINVSLNDSSYHTMATLVATGGGWPWTYVNPAYGSATINCSSVSKDVLISGSTQTINMGYQYVISFEEYANWAGGTNAVNFSCNLSNVSYQFYIE